MKHLVLIQPVASGCNALTNNLQNIKHKHAAHLAKNV
jgi:hypothetical protein